MKTFYIVSQTAFTDAELDMIDTLVGTSRSVGGKGKVVSILMDAERLQALRIEMSRLNPTCEIKTTLSLCSIPEDEESVHEDNAFEPAMVRSLTDPSEYIADRPRVPLELFEHLQFIKIATSASSLDILEFYKEFLLLSRVSPEVVIIARTPTDVQALYGFSNNDNLRNVRQRLIMRKRSCAVKKPHLGSVEVHMKFVKDRKNVVTFIQEFYREIVCTEGVEMEAIAEMAHARSPHVPSNLTTNTKRTAEEIDEEGRQKISQFLQKINEAVPIEEQVQIKFKLDEDTISDLVTNRVFMLSDRTFLRANRRHIQNLIDQQIRQFKESEPAEAKSKRIKTLQDGRRALAETYAQKIREYCDERVDEHGFCNLKNAYTHKILAKLVGDELITDEEYDESRAVKDIIDELLTETRTLNEESNKGDLSKAKELARRILEIFLFELCMDHVDFTELDEEPRRFVREKLYENEGVSFGASQLTLFNGVHHDFIITTVRSEFRKMQEASNEFVRTEQLRRSAEVDDPEREVFEARQCAKQVENDELQEFLGTLQSNREDAIRVFRGEKFLYDSAGLHTVSTNGKTPEQIEIIETRNRLDEQFKRLRARYNVKKVDDLRTKFQRIETYVRDLSRFRPSLYETRKYLRAHINEILANE